MRRKYHPPWWVENERGCWIWQGSIHRDSYGRWRTLGTSDAPTTAHRAVYEAMVGPIPEGMELDHLCRVKACVRPDHLDVVTRTENERRKAALITHCPHGHEYTPENTRLWRGWRFCRACARRYAKRVA